VRVLDFLVLLCRASNKKKGRGGREGILPIDQSIPSFRRDGKGLEKQGQKKSISTQISKRESNKSKLPTNEKKERERKGGRTERLKYEEKRNEPAKVGSYG